MPEDVAGEVGGEPIVLVAGDAGDDRHLAFAGPSAVGHPRVRVRMVIGKRGAGMPPSESTSGRSGGIADAGKPGRLRDLPKGRTGGR